jgi:tetrahydromethanopterin S-methyltransferase subunit G
MFTAANRPTRTILRSDETSLDSDQVRMMKKAGEVNKLSLPKGVKTPGNFDGRKVWNGLINPPADQGTCGSCWAWSSTSVLADRMNIQSLGKLNLNLSAARLIICDLEGATDLIVKDEAKGSQALQKNACFGNSLYNAWRYLYLIGTVSEACFPYDFTGMNTPDFNSISSYSNPSNLPLCSMIAGPFGDMCSDYVYERDIGELAGTPARFYRALHIYAISGTHADGGNEENIRNEIYHWGPVSSGFIVYPDFYTFDAKTEIYEWDGIGERTGGHAIEIVGWGEKKQKKFWIIKNSWGTDWGDGGYFRMLRGENMCDLEANVMAGTPDFFYPYKKQFDEADRHSEEIKLSQSRRDLVISLNMAGGGIDAVTGYSRRAMHNMPWVKFNRPVPLDNLPDWNDFVAGKVTKRIGWSIGWHEFIGIVILLLLMMIFFCVFRNLRPSN